MRKKMGKRLIAGLMTATMMLSLAGCGEEKQEAVTERAPIDKAKNVRNLVERAEQEPDTAVSGADERAVPASASFRSVREQALPAGGRITVYRSGPGRDIVFSLYFFFSNRTPGCIIFHTCPLPCGMFPAGRDGTGNSNRTRVIEFGKICD